MSRLTVLLTAGACGLAVTLLAAQKPAARPRSTFVELGVVVADADGLPVRGLKQDDFRVKDDGKGIAITSFREVSAAGISGSNDARSVTLLLDDQGVGPRSTLAVQSIARFFISYARPADHVAVVRLTRRQDDEVAGDLQDALERIAEYRGGALPFFGLETFDDALKSVAGIARQVESIEHQRKVLVCIGALEVCDPYVAVPQDSLIWPSWLDALSSTARADLSVYVADSSGVRSGFDLGGGLVEKTGGTAFVSSNNFTRAAERVWSEAGHYYLIGYAPTARPRELHSIDVTVKRKGLDVRARRVRGDS